METLELPTTTNFSQYLNLYSKVYPRYMPSVTWDKGWKISEGIFNLAQILKNPNQITISKGFTVLRRLGLVILSGFLRICAKLKTPSEIFPPLKKERILLAFKTLSIPCLIILPI